MRGIGRILGILGAVLIAAGIVGPIIGVGDFNIFPGIVLLFIARVISKQAGQAATKKEPEKVEEQAHPLNTERRRAAPTPPRRQPPPARKPAPPPPPRPVEVEVEVEPTERESIFESILLAGTELAEERQETPIPDEPVEPGTFEPMTSEEMIARAHRRWDRRP